MGTQLLVGVLASSGLGAIASAILVGLFNKRKLGADATEVLTRAAAGIAERLEKELARKQEEHNAEVSELRDEVRAGREELARVKREWRKERDDWRRVNQLHVAFDLLAISKLSEAGIDLGMEPPPLLPPIRANLD